MQWSVAAAAGLVPPRSRLRQQAHGSHVGEYVHWKLLSDVFPPCSDPSQPLPAWRRRVVVFGSKSTKVMLAMLGVWVRMRGWENMERGQKEHAVVIFNHVSFVSDAASQNIPIKF